MDSSAEDSILNTELKLAVICSSNQNRSMEAHNFLRYCVTCDVCEIFIQLISIITFSTVRDL